MERKILLNLILNHLVKVLQTKISCVQGYPDNILNELNEEQKANTDFIIPEKGPVPSVQ